MMTESNSDILKRSQQGDISAFEELIVSYEKLIYNIAYRMFSNSEDAKDVTQEVFIKIYKNINKCSDLKVFKNWACTIATNTCIDELRRRKGVYTENIDDILEVDFVAAKLKIVTPEEIVLKKEGINEIQSCMNRLSPEYKVLIILRDVQGMSYQEISEITNVQLGTVKSRISRARKNLRNLLVLEDKNQ